MKNINAPHLFIIPRDGGKESPWQHNLPAIMPGKYENKADDIYDCLVIGGGITGLTVALMLQKAGKKTVIAEAHNIGFGTTGGTSAHINTFADTTYKEAESAFGKDGAKLFADAVNEGFDIIKQNIAAYKIDCDYEPKTGYVYAETDDEVKQLQELYDGTAKVGVAVDFVDEVPIPIPFKNAVKLDGQAQFHPLKYLQGLEREYLAAGGMILENTKIENIESKKDLHIAKATGIDLKAKKVIYATHIPPGITLFSFRCAPYRSYVMGVKLKNDQYPDALVYDMQEPYHYFRTHVVDGQQLLIVGGNDHKTGHEDPEKAFDDLEKYVRKYFNVSSIKYKWSSQYYIPVDGLPYVGQIPFSAGGVYCATGFNGNGMMLGSVSAKILADLVLGKENKYGKIFAPSRIKPVDGFTEFIQENADVAYHFIADRLSVKETDSLKRLRPGDGKVVEFEGKKVAAYRDENGAIHALNPVCTHAKCIVNWNSEEKSWDCPCHGARFDIDGKVLNGPADKDLEKFDY
jgi:glycine/D-amino acid oxidase-like deaminating enzyme/nitrite reductase/ring-hydroxylating ferredoxin subunit